MPRKGRNLELLIEKIESVQLPEGASIESPGYLIDKITGSKREVDVLIKYKVGSVPIIIIIECRDRNSTEDTTWIEQLNTKIKDINANKIIAVSSNGFGSPAKLKAIHYGIETRTLNNIDQREISDWFSLDYLINEFHGYEIVNADILFVSDVDTEKVKPFLAGKTVADLFMYTRTKDTPNSLNSIFQFEATKNNFWKDISQDKEPIRRSYNIYFESQARYYVGERHMNLIVESIVFDTLLYIKTEKLGIEKIEQYSSDSEIIGDHITFNPTSQSNEKIQITRTASGKMAINVKKST